ncbi:lipid phosphate phosphatase 3 [Euphorbia peplus]|nr:lipid phosphate phosphatase 3 [Euphorbia peplus]
MSWWDLGFFSWFKNFSGIFQDASSKRLEIAANTCQLLSSLDLPLIEQENEENKMREVQLGSHTVRSHAVTVARTHVHDWVILILLGLIEILLNIMQPFYRFVSKDMMTDLKYPMKSNTVPIWTVPVYAILLPLVVFIVIYFRRRDVYDLHHAILGLFYSMLVTGVLTDSIKNAVGRPRPDFFWRCFPDGKDVYDKLGDVICHGDESVIKEGHKSFPSGHTSWSFAGLGFLSLYLSGKIQVFDRKGHVAKLCIVILPLLFACLVGISRVDDYWHHWQDVFAGGLLGLTVATFCYLQFFPPPYHPQGWGPYAYFRVLEESRRRAQPSSARRQASMGSNQLNSVTNETEVENEDESGGLGLHLISTSNLPREDVESGSK